MLFIFYKVDRKILKLFAFLLCNSKFYLTILHIFTTKPNSSPSGLNIWQPYYKYGTNILFHCFFCGGKDWLELFACAKITQFFIHMIYVCIFEFIFFKYKYIYSNYSIYYNMLTILMKNMETNATNFEGKC